MQVKHKLATNNGKKQTCKYLIGFATLKCAIWKHNF